MFGFDRTAEVPSLFGANGKGFPLFRTELLMDINSNGLSCI